MDRRRLFDLVRRALVAAALLIVPLVAVPAGAVPLFLDADPLDELQILAVRGDQPAEVLFAAPARLVMETLTGQDVVATVDGTEQEVRLQRLAATDLEVGIVVDTTLPQAEVRDIQGAVVELALDLPQGATLRLIDAQGDPSAAAAVPGPAIAQVRGLTAETGGDLQEAVTTAVDLLDDSPQDRTALLVVGRDLGQRIEAVDDQPLTRTTYIVDVAGGAQQDAGDGLLGPQAAGTVIGIDETSQVLPAIDEVSQDLRNLYRAEITVPDGGARTLTLDIPAAGEEAPSRTVALDTDGIRPVEADPDAPGDGEAPQADQPDDGAQEPASGTGGDGDVAATELREILAPAAFAGAALIVLALLWLLKRTVGPRTRAWWRRRRSAVPPAVGFDDHPPDDAVHAAAPAAPPVDGTVTGATTADGTADHHTAAPADGPRWGGTDPDGSDAGGRRGPAGPHTRPIAKLSTSTREALAHAHLGLRRLALASREAADSVPDDLFRLTEALASVALSGPHIDLDDVLVARMNADEAEGDVGLVLRTATALATGWQHTARRSSAPPPVIEINAVLSGSAPNRPRKGPQRPVAPVRALNPLVEIGLEHIVLAGRPGDDSDLVARAVTAVDVMRAARLARPALAMSPWLLTAPDRYRACLAADLADPPQRDDWLEFLCASIARGAAESAERLRRLDQLRTRYRERSSDTRMLPLIDLMLSHPVLDQDLVARRLSTSRGTARVLLSDVFEAGWLQPHKRLDDTWVADQVLVLFANGAGAREPTSQPA